MAGVSFAVGGRGRFDVPLLGEHNVLNALLAMTVAWRMGATDEQVRAGLRKVTPAPIAAGADGSRRADGQACGHQ